MDPSNIKKVQQWVECDNKILRHKELIKDAVELKKECEKAIIESIEQNKQNHLVINIADGVIRFPTRNQSQPISLKFLKTILEKFSVDKTTIDHDDIYKFIVDNIEKKTNTIIERKFKE